MTAPTPIPDPTVVPSDAAGITADRRRAALTTALEVAGLAAIVTAVLLVSVPGGIATAGACLVLVGYLFGGAR